MTPILHELRRRLRLRLRGRRRSCSGETERPINRVFTIRFPDRATADRLFADPAYLAVRGALFEPAVSHVTTLATFDER